MFFSEFTVYLFRHAVCGLVVRVPGYRFQGPWFDSRCYQNFQEVVGLERGPFNLVSTTEELLGRHALKSREYGRAEQLDLQHTHARTHARAHAHTPAHAPLHWGVIGSLGTQAINGPIASAPGNGAFVE
jgi:hypothetical protein